MALHTSIFSKAKTIALTAMLSSLLVSPVTHGITGTSASYSATPPTASTSQTPLVMLVMSNDHQLYYKAYNDWSDLNGDGVIDSTYNHDIDYYGYFDSYKCYDYSNGQARFEPDSETTDKYCDGPGQSNTWSGNFLNWATMTRMDVLRKVLYGGKRVVDAVGDTVLERAYLPSDAHSFAKFADPNLIPRLEDLTPFDNAPGITAGTGLTFCNTTYATSGESQNTTVAPMLRIVNGDFRYWGANERWQCTWDDERGDNSNSVAGNNPASANGSDPDRLSDGATYSSKGPQFTVRVEVCKSGLLGKEKCKNYSTNNYKPIGLLHVHGEDESMHFGLLTGSYEKNKSGGVVRKDISIFSDELLADGTGRFDTSVDGIVSTINKFRISKYQYSSGYYNGSDNCPWGLTSFSDGDCSNWGNPASEMFLEAVRYFAGKNKNATFDADDSSYIPGLTDVTSWSDPLSSANYCASCNIIMLNTSDFSYDDDSLGMGGLPGSPNAKAFTNVIGVREGISGNQYFVGENGAASPDQLCTAKTITNLGDVKGLCPGSPRLEGTYNMAGIAYYAHIADLRSGLQGEQKVNTYAIALSPAVPKIEIPVPGSTTGQKVSILPACRNSDLTPNGNCAIVDFKIIDPHTEAAGVGTGSFYVNWEDSEQGGDYDQDMKGTIEYSITGTDITVTTTVDSKFGSYPMGFGYVISGTTMDGFRVHSGVDGFTYTDPDGVDDCNPACNLADGAKSYTYTLGTSSASLLEDPLWYVAKWGSFNDVNNNNEPDLDNEWDITNNITGETAPDGVPDNYFLVTNPATLEARLSASLDNIRKRVSSGTAAAVIADSVSMQGAVVQALYQPSLFVDGKSISWSGLVHSIFLSSGGFYEDTDGDAQLTASDKQVSLIYYPDVKRTQVFYPATGERKEVYELNSIWNARDQLAIFDATDSRLTSQRTYTTAFDDTTNGGRYIFTWLDNDLDGEVDSSEMEDFTASTFTSSNYGYLNANDETEADNIVNFLRGIEDPGTTGYRNRSINHDKSADGSELIWRLGDIIHSSPAIVAEPNSSYDYIQNDTTYRDFKAAYQDRRRVVYMGANDGMVHAFNAGFYDAINNRYCTAPLPGCTSASAHPLGAELWAYVPQNLLPHLRWQTEPGYPHVFYVDGEPRVYDVNIFPDDAVHPYGWGTILVIGMRMGGAPIGVDIDNADNDEDGSTNTDFTARSAYMIFDVTDPEQPPKLLAEITNPDLGLTTSTPNIVVKRAPDANVNWDNPTVNDWYLTFGTGPNVANSVTSTQNAKLMFFKLELNADDTLDTGSSNFFELDTGVANSFVGDPETTHWPKGSGTPDMQTDAVYFGIVGGTELAPDGRLMRVRLEGNDPSMWLGYSSTIINTGQPFLPQPNSNYDTDDYQWWVHTGTGRLYTFNDNKSTTQQSYYGFKETPLAASPTLPESITHTTNQSAGSYLQDVTDINVYHLGEVEIPPTLTNLVADLGGTDATFNDFEAAMKDSKRTGWFFDFTDTGERNLVTSVRWDAFTGFTSYIPSADECQAEGNSVLYLLYTKTGTAYPNAGLRNNTSITHSGTGSFYTKPKTDMGVGIASKLTVIPAPPPPPPGGGGGGGGGCDPTVDPNCPCESQTSKLLGQMSTGELKLEDACGKPPGETSRGRQSWREIFNFQQ